MKLKGESPEKYAEAVRRIFGIKAKDNRDRNAKKRLRKSRR